MHVLHNGPDNQFYHLPVLPLVVWTTHHHFAHNVQHQPLDYNIDVIQLMFVICLDTFTSSKLLKLCIWRVQQLQAMPPKDPRIQGGYKQRLRAAHHESVAESNSNLAALLVRKWAWGELSSPAVQELAQAAVKDGARGDELKRLSKLGTAGKHTGNCYRDLMSILKPTNITSALACITVHVMRSTISILQCTQKILLPHQMFHVLYTCHP